MGTDKKAIQQKKDFDAVKTMREIREELSEKYWKQPDILKQEMEAIRKKYNLDVTVKEPAEQRH